MHIPRSTAILLILLWMAGSTLAQVPPAGDLQCKSVSDTILGQRLLVLPDPFSPKRALARLFPGKWYDLSQPKFANQLISWKCPRCTPKIYPDVNEMDTLLFPDPAGLATRLLNVFTFTDSSGREVKVMSFNHSGYDPDGMQTGRYSGGCWGSPPSCTWTEVGGWRNSNPRSPPMGPSLRPPNHGRLKLGRGNTVL